MAESIEQKKTLLSMARAFRTDIQDIQQKGAGYYSCDPFVKRYNKLLAKARELFAGGQTALLDSFDELEDTKSVDPTDKMKVTQRVIIELGQLIAFMESIINQEEQKRRARAESPVAKESGEVADGEESPNVTE
jgi:hypothetical protein